MKVPRRAPTPRPTGRDRARPAAGRGTVRSAVRPAVRSARGRIPAQAGPVEPRVPGSAPRTYFTRRAAVFASVLFLVAVSVAYPAQHYVAQRQNIDDLRSQVAAGTERVADLERAVEAADEPYAIERAARARLHFVLPGEQAYRVTDPMVDPGAVNAAAGPTGPWWEQLVGSVAEAATPVESLPVSN